MSETQRILVVDDDDAVRTIAVEMLRRSGHEVEGVGDGDSALKQQAQTPFALILLDVSMPGGLSGEEVHTHLRDRGDAVHVVFMTGHEPGRLADLLAPNTTVLQKPFTLAGIQGAVEQALAAAG